MASESQDRSNKNMVVMQSKLFSHEGELVWSVNELSQFENSSIVSNEFSIVPCCKITWEVILHLGDDVETTEVEIRRKDAVQNTFTATIECSFENSKGEAQTYYFVEKPFINNADICILPHISKYLLETRYGKWNFEKCSHDDLLIVRCQIIMKNCCTNTTIENSEYKTSFPRSPLSMDFIKGFERLYTERLYADVELQVDEMSYPGHKAILCIRSPHFRKMFETDMIENRTGVVKIEDAKPKIIEAFLSYLYTDSIAELSIEEIRELYAVADKYQVGSLQDKCRCFLLENLQVTTVCKTLILAHLHNDDILQKAASKYISDHMPTFQHSPEFESLKDKYPRLILDIVMAYQQLQSQLLNNATNKAE